MIRLVEASKSYYAGSGRKIVLDEQTCTLPWRNIGLLGVNGAGKSTLIRLLSGTELPDSGEIRRDVTVSWPLGFSGAFHGSLTGEENLKFVCRIYSRPFKEVLDFVEDFAELGSYMRMPVKTYSSGMRSRLAFALSMAVDFDCYLVDEITAVGDSRFQERCAQAFAAKRSKSRIIMVSHSESTIQEYCDIGCVLANGRLTLYDDLGSAFAAYNKVLEGAKENG